MAESYVPSIIGGGLGLLNYAQSNANDSARQKALAQIAEQYGTDSNAIIEAAHQAGIDNYSDYLDLIGSIDWDSDEYKTNFNKDDYNAENYYATNRAQQVGNAARAAQGSAALSGMGRSSSAAMGIANAVADKNESLYRDAQSAMKQDRSFDYQVAQNEAQEKLAALKNKVNAQKEIADTNNDLDQDYASNKLGALNTQTNLDAQSAAYSTGKVGGVIGQALDILF